MTGDQTGGERAPERFSGDAGANLVEYAMLLAFIFVVALAAMTYFGEEASSNFIRSCEQIGNAGGGTANCG